MTKFLNSLATVALLAMAALPVFALSTANAANLF
jgi:hypothetical protein